MNSVIAKQPIKAKGKHLLIDLYEAQNINDIEQMKSAFYEIIKQTKTTLLFENFHHFTPSGLTGIVCLAESHISVHTWPEENFAAFDVFMCGDADPEKAIGILKQYFGGIEKVTLLKRGY